MWIGFKCALLFKMIFLIPTLFCSVFAKQQTWFMFESRVLETEQGSYQIGCGMTLPEALWWDTVCPAHLSWRKSASLQARCGERWRPSPSASLGFGLGPAGSTLRSALVERVLPGKAEEEMFLVGLLPCSLVLLQK